MRLSRNSLRGRSYYILPLSLRIATAGSKGDITLLWNQVSDASQVLTDDLRGAGFEQNVLHKYYTWSKNANKPSTLSPVTAGSGVDLLKSMTKITRAFNTWPQIRGKAVSREAPILVCTQKYDDDNLYYFQYDGLKVGLIKAANLSKIVDLKIKNMV